MQEDGYLASPQAMMTGDNEDVELLSERVPRAALLSEPPTVKRMAKTRSAS